MRFEDAIFISPYLVRCWTVREKRSGEGGGYEKDHQAVMGSGKGFTGYSDAVRAGILPFTRSGGMDQPFLGWVQC